MKNLFKQFKQNKGFTLIELLITMAIIALLMSIGLPYLSKAMEYAKINGDMEKIVVYTQRARGEVSARRKVDLANAEPRVKGADYSGLAVIFHDTDDDGIVELAIAENVQSVDDFIYKAPAGIGLSSGYIEEQWLNSVDGSYVGPQTHVEPYVLINDLEPVRLRPSIKVVGLGIDPADTTETKCVQLPFAIFFSANGYGLPPMHYAGSILVDLDEDKIFEKVKLALPGVVLVDDKNLNSTVTLTSKPEDIIYKARGKHVVLSIQNAARVD